MLSSIFISDNEDFKSSFHSKKDYLPSDMKYVTLNRKGYECIHNRNYLSGLELFKKCYELSIKDLHDNLKEINSLMNISICEYYNGNFSESYKVISKAKDLYNSHSLGANIISPKLRLHLTLKLFINSSLINLSINKYTESKNDIRFLLSIIRQESDYNNQYLYFKSIIFTLFRVESLVNFDEINNNENSSEKVINHLMKGFLNFLKEQNFDELLDTFKEAALKYQRLDDYYGFHFCFFYHYLLLYNSNKFEDNRKKISAFKKNLI